MIRQVGVAQRKEGVQQCDKSAAAVVAAEAINAVTLERGHKWVVLPGGGRLHGVNMGIEQQSGSVALGQGLLAPNVVVVALRIGTTLFKIVKQKVGRNRLVAAHRGYGHKALQQLQGLSSDMVKLLCCHGRNLWVYGVTG